MKAKSRVAILSIVLSFLSIPSLYAADDEAYIQQLDGSSNSAVVKQIDGTKDYVNSIQTSSESNNLYVSQDQNSWSLGSTASSPNGNWAFVRQEIDYPNNSRNSKLYLNQEGNNLLTGVIVNFSNLPNFGFIVLDPVSIQGTAYQQSSLGSNLLVVNQSSSAGQNVAALYQRASGNNKAFITQTGANNQMVVWQDGNIVGGFTGSNTLTAGKNESGNNQTIGFTGADGVTRTGIAGQSEGGNIARLVQVSPSALLGKNVANIAQHGGNNKLGGIHDVYEVDTDSEAFQGTLFSGNQLNLIQEGGSNETGIYQRSTLGTSLSFPEFGNVANVYQSGSDVTTISQQAITTNSATVIQ